MNDISSSSRQSMLVLLCTFDEKGVTQVKEVAQDPKCRGGEGDFALLVNKLESGDLDTQVFSLSLINTLIAGTTEGQAEFIELINGKLGLEQTIRVSGTGHILLNPSDTL